MAPMTKIPRRKTAISGFRFKGSSFVLDSVNEELETNPGLINNDCYGKGWLYKIKPSDKSELENLIKGEEAITKWVLADIEKYKDEG